MQDRNNKDIICNSDEKQQHFSRLQQVQQQQFVNQNLPIQTGIDQRQITCSTSVNKLQGTPLKLGQTDNNFENGQQTINQLNIRRPIDSTDLPLGHFQQELSEPLTFVDAINNANSNMSGSQNSGFNYQDQEIQIKKRQKFGKATSDLGLQKAVSRSNYLEHDKNTQNCSATTNNPKYQSNNDLIGTSSHMFQSYYDGPTQNMDQLAHSSDLFIPNKKNQYEKQTLNDSFSKQFQGRDQLYERALSSNAGVLQKTNSYNNILQMAANQNAFQQSSTMSRMHAPSAGKTQRRRENKSFMKDRLVTSAIQQEQQQETVVRGQRQQDASQSNPESLSNVCGDFLNETAEFQGGEQAPIQQELYTGKNAGNWSEDGAESDDQSSVQAKSSNQYVWKECEQFSQQDDGADFTFDNVNQFEDKQQVSPMSQYIQSSHATSSLNEVNQINQSGIKNQIPLIKIIGDVDTSSQSQQQHSQIGQVSLQQREQQQESALSALSALADKRMSKPPLGRQGHHAFPPSRTRSNSAINPKTKVIHQKMVCYVSSFHLSINDWFSEYENIEILKDNLSNRLGAHWSKQFKQSIKSPFEDVSTGALFDMLMGGSTSANLQSSDVSSLGLDLRNQQNNEDTSQVGDDEDTGIDEQYFQLMFNLYLIKCYQATNIAEAYLTQKHFEASKVMSSQFNCDRTFDLFFHEAVNFVSGKGYLITDANLFRQVVQKFYYDAQSEYEKILIKIGDDQKSKINFTEKALKQFDEIQRKQSLLDKEMRLQMLNKSDHNQQLIDEEQSQMIDHSSGPISSQSNNIDMNQDDHEDGDSSANKQIEQKEQRKSYLGLDYARINEMGTSIPGFQTVKNNVIKPLIVATEKVVEYYFADSSNSNQPQLPPVVNDEEQQLPNCEKDAQIGQLNAENAAATDKQTAPSTQAQSMLTTAPSLQSSTNIDMCQFPYDSTQIPQQQSLSQQNKQPMTPGGKCPTSLIKTLQIQLDNLHLTTTDEDEVEGNLVRAQDNKKKHKSQVAKSQAGAPLDDGEMSFDNQGDDDDKRSNKSIQLGTLRGLGKKRTYRELERWDIQASKEQRHGLMDDSKSMSGKSSKSMRKGNGVRTLKFNSRLLQKASTAVDLISQKIEFKNLMNQSVTGSFVTVILELTSDFIDKLEQQEQEIIQQQVQIATSSTGEAPSNLNIKFVKPSPHFYNKIMSLWFKFNHYQTLGNGASDQNNMLNMLEPQLKALFLDFCIMQFREVGSWNDQLHRPLENFIQIIVREHLLLQAQSRTKNLESQAANSDDKNYDSPNSNSSEDNEPTLKQLFSDISKRAYNSVLAHGPSIFSSSKNTSNKKDDDKMDQQSNSAVTRQDQGESPEMKRKNKLRKMRQNAMSQISMCTLFYNIKSALMKQWEVEIVQRGTQFESRKEQIGSFQ